MESQATATIPESLREAYDAFMINNLELLKNVFITFKHAALWEEENPSLEGPSWSYNLEDVIRPLGNSLSIAARTLADASNAIAPQSSQADVGAACESFLTEVSKLLDLLAMFEVVAQDEDESGHRDTVSWSRAFEVLLDSLKRIGEGSDKLWEILVEAPKRQRTEQRETPA
jgi:hypothetical protein